MPSFDCAICGKSVTNSYLCPTCKALYRTNTMWASALIDEERNRRRLEKQDDRFGMTCLSDYQLAKGGNIYDGWDVLYATASGIGGEVRDITAPSWGEQESVWTNGWQFDVLEHWGKQAKLTRGEMGLAFALILAESDVGYVELSSEAAAKWLSEIEEKPVSAVAYRRRLSDLRRKLRPVVARLRQKG